MIFKVLHALQVDSTSLKNLQQSHLSSNLVKTIKFSSQTTVSTRWAQDNQLFQRHPQLLFFEQLCAKTSCLLKQVLSYVFVSGLHRNPFVMSRLLYASLIELGETSGMKNLEHFGVQIFNQVQQPNIFSWNTMIRFFGSLHDAQNSAVAFRYYMAMLSQETIPDRYTFPFLLQACGASSDANLVKQVYSHILKLGFGHDLFVQNSLLYAFWVCDLPIEAWKLFDEMSQKDVISWTSLISGLVSRCEYREALLVFKKLMVDDDLPCPNVVTMVCIMSACGNLGSFDHTKCMHALLVKAVWVELEISVVNSLIDAYAKCGNICYAKKVFDENQHMKKDLFSWTTIISAFAMHGRGLDSLNLFSQMEQESRLVPDEVTFLAVLSGCAHSGLVEEGLCIFESMNKRYQIEPNLRHYGCIVDLLGRTGMLEQAYDIIENMPMNPNLAILGSLLNGCRLHNNLVLGVAVLRKIEMLKEKGGSPVLLSNMYANEHQWAKVMHIRKEMRESVQEKPPGRSWIVVKDAVYEFFARNDFSPQDMELHIALESLEKIAMFPTSIWRNMSWLYI